MDVTHYVLHKTKCNQCGRMVNAKLPNHLRYGYGPRLTALMAEMSGVDGLQQGDGKNILRLGPGFSHFHWRDSKRDRPGLGSHQTHL